MAHRLTIHLDNHGQLMTVSEMRRRLAQVLSKLHGGAEVGSFSLDIVLPNYEPQPVASMTVRGVISAMHEEAVYGELARPEND